MWQPRQARHGTLWKGTALHASSDLHLQREVRPKAYNSQETSVTMTDMLLQSVVASTA